MVYIWAITGINDERVNCYKPFGKQFGLILGSQGCTCVYLPAVLFLGFSPGAVIFQRIGCCWFLGHFKSNSVTEYHNDEMKHNTMQYSRI